MTTPYRKTDRLFPMFRALVTKIIAQADRECEGKDEEFVRWHIVETWRSIQRQRELGSTLKATPTRPGPHNFGAAIDVCWIDKDGNVRWDAEELWQRLGHAARAHHCTWGGDWTNRDMVHIQASANLILLARAWKQLQSWGKL